MITSRVQSSQSKIRSKEKTKTKNVIDFILRDHKPLKKLIVILKNPKIGVDKKYPAFTIFARELFIHSRSEEESLYVLMKKFDRLRVEANEAETEHALTDHLVQEIRKLSSVEAGKPGEKSVDRWIANVKMLAELVEHHLEQEETKVLKGVRKQLDSETLVNLGKDYSRLLNFHKTLVQKSTDRGTESSAKQISKNKEVPYENRKDGKKESDSNNQPGIWSKNQKVEKHKDFYR